jgi:hypothetical protein
MGPVSMVSQGNFATRVFLGAGIYGLIVLLPLFFMETKLGQDCPPPLTHPEYYYVFTGIALSWQVVFLVIARDVRRYRPLMLPAVLEKLAFGIPAFVLYAQGRAALLVVCFGAVDLVLAALFVLAFRASRTESR